MQNFERNIYGWDLNIWNENDGSIVGVEDQWRITAYPFDINEDIIGTHTIYVSLDLNETEVKALRLGELDNEYDPSEDFWTGCDYFIQEYPYAIPERILDWLESLPATTDSINLQLF